MWGKRLRRRDEYPRPHRFTPTRVGKTRREKSKPGRTLGSPPRVWGKHLIKPLNNILGAVHPHACGENISFLLPGGLFASVHPHACGENSRRVARFRLGHNGSPPRVWGKRLGENYQAKRQNGSPPRVWGKRLLLHTLALHRRGSPPRVWGKRDAVGVKEDVTGRFTPTRVGKTVWGWMQTSLFPRFTPTRVGKTKNTSSIFQPPTGSPPRVWGKRSISRRR